MKKPQLPTGTGVKPVGVSRTATPSGGAKAGTSTPGVERIVAARRPAPPLMPQRVRQKDATPTQSTGLGLTSERALQRMIERLRAAGGTDERVLAAMQSVPRHLFVDEAFASRAYEDAALPIGHRQTISSPVTVARMLSLLLNRPAVNGSAGAGGSEMSAGRTGCVLEVGAGCGYQAAVLARLYGQVYSIERLEALFDKAKGNLTRADSKAVQLVYGDGFAGLPDKGPFDAIIVAAAGTEIPKALMEQMAVGGRMVLPLVEGRRQVLAVVDRTPTRWTTERMDIVNFVPLLQGTVARS